ncbi:glycosyl hydrolase family 28-related protein [Brevibacillus ginsengisoli]|uniref:right-handed parallel beta-helix repeat-containing protein n=1 Tax=Brevibacillus ginsengisoli TaxID=363854 RepID=UPI003CE9D958
MAFKLDANERVNVMEYGAKGNGTTDDTAAIKAALAVLQSGVASVLVFPKGTYKISGPLEINKASNIYVEGNGSVIKGGRHDLFRVQDSSYIEINRLTFDPAAVPGTARFLRGIKLSYVSLCQCQITNGALAYFYSAYDGDPIDYNDKTFWNQFLKLDRCKATGEYRVDNLVMCQKTNNIVITQCLFEKATGDGVKFNGGDSENLNLSYNEFRYLNGDGIDMFGSGRFLHIHDNYFHHVRGFPANLKLSGDVNNQGATSYKAWFVRNRVEQNALGLGLANGKNILIQSNTFRNNGVDPVDGTMYSHLINVEESAEDIRMIDNDFFDNHTKQAIVTLGQTGTGVTLHTLIRDNRFRNNSAPYLLYIGKSDSTANRLIDIVNNLFDGFVDRAIAVQITKGNVTIRNNQFVNGLDAIRLMTIGSGVRVFVRENIAQVTGSPLVNDTSVNPTEQFNSWNP